MNLITFVIRCISLTTCWINVHGAPRFRPDKKSRSSRSAREFTEEEKYLSEDDAMHPMLPILRRSLMPNPEHDTEFWKVNAQNFLRNHLGKQNNNLAKNIILVIGDGLSISTITAARVYNNVGGSGAQLSFEMFPHTGLSKTYCLDQQTADSACSATAYLTGVKANYGTIGVNGHVQRKSCEDALDPSTHVYSIAKWAQDSNLVTGLVTTTRVTHASPAGVYAHAANRMWETDKKVAHDSCDPEKIIDIAQQLIYGEGRNLRVILGGGRAVMFDESILDVEKGTGRRTDGKNLVEDWQSFPGKREYVWNRDQLLEVDLNETEYLLGLFEAEHMMYNLDVQEQSRTDTEPTLTEMVNAAISILEKHSNGYFLFVEGGLIDHAHHGNKARMALDETIELSRAVAQIRARTSEQDTLIVFTSDHAHTMSFSGYSSREENVLGYGGTSGFDHLKYFTLSYANGRGYYPNRNIFGDRLIPSEIIQSKSNFTYPTTVPLKVETHGSDDVAVYASGPRSHLFSGSYEQNVIPHIMAYAACIGNGLTACYDETI